MRRIFLYLILNFLVSALAVLMVLVIWDSTHKGPGQGQISKNEPTAIPTANSESLVFPALTDKTIEIQTVVAAGDLLNERVLLISVSSSPINLSGWRLVDEDQTVFTFPDLTIYPGGGLNLYSKAGVNSAIDLFWGQENAVWESGESATLFDPGGNKRFGIVIP